MTFDLFDVLLFILDVRSNFYVFCSLQHTKRFEESYDHYWLVNVMNFRRRKNRPTKFEHERWNKDSLGQNWDNFYYEMSCSNRGIANILATNWMITFDSSLFIETVLDKYLIQKWRDPSLLFALSLCQSMHLVSKKTDTTGKKTVGFLGDESSFFIFPLHFYQFDL